MNSPWQTFEKRYPLALSSLRSAKSGGRLAHAYLLCSANPEYRLEFPPLLAALAVCRTPNPDFSPCGTCPTCREFFRGTFPDCYTLAPFSKSRQILVGNSSDEPGTMRWFNSIFHLRGMTTCGWKVGIIQDCECLNETAQNAFLKTLEEPPEKCLFILTTANPSQLLPTIRSRCQSIHLVDNACVYDFPGAGGLPGILSGLVLKARGNLAAANDAADAILSLKESLNDAAEKSTAEKWKPRLDAAQNLESAGKNLLEKRVDADQNGEYRRMRAELVSAIHAFFAELEMRKSGISRSMLPNPELLPEDPGLEKIDPALAARLLDFAEDLVRAMRTNADDELAIRSFCLKAAFQ